MSAGSPFRPTPQNGRRSNSLVGNVGSFIKRTRSSDLLNRQNSSGILHEGAPSEGSLGSPVDNTPPQLPAVQPQPQLQTFGGESHVPKMEAPQSQAPAPVAHTRAESITNRGRYSYATSTISSVNSPRRMRRRKDPSSYNVLIIGARNSGKTSFLKFLKRSLAPHSDEPSVRNPELDNPPPSAKTTSGSFIQHYQEIDVENERIGISIWDSQGFEKNVVDFQLREMNNFVESKFEDTFIEEMKVVRSPGYRDTHIHCVFYLFDPAELDMNINSAKKSTNDALGSLRKPTRVIGALDEDFELQILKSLQGKTTVIPVISKADTVTTAHMEYLKKKVGESFLQAGLDPLEALHFEQTDDEDDLFDEAEEDAFQAQTVTEKPLDQVQDEVVKPATAGGEVKAEVEETPNDTLSPESVQNAGSAAEDTPANTSRTYAHKRESSKLSVSNVMFDNGYMPMSILSPDDHSLGDSKGPVGRQFIWGFADPYNPMHCDFVKLKETCFEEWRPDFKEASREVFYERWRTTRLNRGPTNGVKKSAPTPTARKASGGIPIELTARTRKFA